MKLCLLAVVVIVWVAWITWLPARARAQSGTDVSSAILVHSDMSTIVRLPDEIEDVWSIGPPVVKVKGVGSALHLLPLPDTPAGAEMFVEVKTRTLHRMFLVRVVERAEDAMHEVTVPAPAAERAAPAPETPSVEPAPAATSASTSSPPPEPAETAPTTLEPARASSDERARASRSSRFELSVHAVAALAGTTEVTVPGASPVQSRQSHRVLGMRVAVAPPDTWWAVEANVSGEWLAAPTVHKSDDLVAVSGPSLHVDVGMRVRFPTRWSPTAYLGLGLQAHHRDLETIDDDEVDNEPNVFRDQSLPFGGVLALGLGLEHRVGDLSLGLEVHVRQGLPDDYHSVAALLSLGFFLDQGE